MAGMSGAYMSRSRIPTAPRSRSALARPSAMVDLPTPPLPAPTATTRRNGELAEEGLPDLALGCGRREDHDPVADLELRVLVCVHELPAPDDPADEGAARQPQATNILSGRWRSDSDLGLDQLVGAARERHERHEAARRELLLDDVHEHAGRGDRLVDPERLEDDLVLRVVDARDHARRTAADLGQLTDHEVLRVVSGDGDQRVGPAASGLHLGATLVGWRVHHD